MPVETQQDFEVAASQISLLLSIQFLLVSCLIVTAEDEAQWELT